MLQLRKAPIQYLSFVTGLHCCWDVDYKQDFKGEAVHKQHMQEALFTNSVIHS